MISPKLRLTRRTLPTVLWVALPQLAFLRALFVRTCDFTRFGSHGPYCYAALPWTRIVTQVLGVLIVSIPVGILIDRLVVRKLPSRIRSRSPDWLVSPSNATLSVFVALCFGLVLFAIFDTRLATWWSFETGTATETFKMVLVWGLYFPTIGIGFGGNYFLAVLTGMVGVTALPVRLLILALMLVCSFFQIVWLYAVAAAVTGGIRRARTAFEAEGTTT